jgi:hypothetical protein
MDSEYFFKSILKSKIKKKEIGYYFLDLENACQKICLNLDNQYLDDKEKNCLINCMSKKVKNTQILEKENVTKSN